MGSRARGRWSGVLASGAVLVAVIAAVAAVRMSGPDSAESSPAVVEFAPSSTTALTTATQAPAVAGGCSMVSAATLAVHAPGAVCAAPVPVQQVGTAVVTIASWQGPGSYVEVRRTVDSVAASVMYRSNRAAAASVFPSFHEAIGGRELVGVGDEGVVISGRSTSGGGFFTAKVDAVSGPVVVDVLAGGFGDAAAAEAAAVAVARDALASPR